MFIEKIKLMYRWLTGILIASVCTFIILKSDIISDKILGPNLFINAVLTPILANIFLFGFTGQLVERLGLMIDQD